MLGQGNLTPTVIAEAEIKAKIADFLAAEKKIVKLLNHPRIDIRTEAAGLQMAQSQLQGELTEVLGLVDKWKTGQWDLSEVGKVTSFGVDLARHLNRVKQLQQKGQAPTEGLDPSQLFEEASPFSMQNAMIFGAVVLFGFFVVRAFQR